jgi:hypothetical protein
MEIRLHLQPRNPEGHGEGEGELARVHGTIMVAQDVEIGRLKGKDPRQPLLIAQGFSQDFGLTQMVEDLLEFSYMEQ